MEKLSDTITSVIRELTAKRTVAGVGPQEWLKNILTRNELRHIKFHYFRKGTMGFYVDSAAWKYNFNLKKEGLLKNIVKYEPQAKELRFSIGEV